MSLLTFKANKAVRHILYYYASFCQFQLPVQTNRKRSLANIKNRCTLLFGEIDQFLVTPRDVILQQDTTVL